MDNAAHKPDPLLTTQQAARFLGHSPRSLEAWRCRGSSLPYCKIGRSVRYLLSDLEKFLADCRRRSTSDPGADHDKLR
ncbi:MAG TPA: helix-turn-helix domain-containing protein [Thermoanaerobaculia bacterium]|nr:helix-turn-helix domain-containing protein [Thermoanaerobaculia bacterium]